MSQSWLSRLNFSGQKILTRQQAECWNCKWEAAGVVNIEENLEFETKSAARHWLTPLQRNTSLWPPLSQGEIVPQCEPQQILHSLANWDLQSSWMGKLMAVSHWTLISCCMRNILQTACVQSCRWELGRVMQNLCVSVHWTLLFSLRSRYFCFN